MRLTSLKRAALSPLLLVVFFEVLVVLVVVVVVLVVLVVVLRDRAPAMEIGHAQVLR